MDPATKPNPASNNTKNKQDCDDTSNHNEYRTKAIAIRHKIHEKLIESGEKERLKELLREHLITCGWRDELKHKCNDIILNKGIDKTSIQELVEEVTPYARSAVPDNIKTELLQHLKHFIDAQLN
ncbi:hypothetical protein RFI_25459 [Reticulomyxa filosa]|uniref:Transcription and mRNA export factor ENY2 n=1 Tax=Reticulomyxa filosa TaxID=46433 RepID=X6MD44_RETFI|nr:hypothetical protein RFI_25459 [Reticulomyxa filosa]|eukprot:ETO11918.1 hypothetical protein RFI_25459 [Reticulomyxa filosa]